MRSLILIFIAMMSFSVFSHVQHPLEIKELSTDGQPRIKITVGNIREIKQSFNVEVNGVLTGQKINLSTEQFKNISVRLPRVQPNQLYKFTVCTVSVPKPTDKVKSKICSEVKVYYPQSSQ